MNKHKTKAENNGMLFCESVMDRNVQKAREERMKIK